MEFVEQVRAALEAHFQGADASGITWDEDTGSVGGLLLWDNFAPMTHRERQRLVFDFLREEFEAQATQISMIFAYSPEEYGVMQAA